MEMSSHGCAMPGSTVDVCSASVSVCGSTVDTCYASVSGCCLWVQNWILREIRGAILGSTVDTCHASIDLAFGRISHFSLST